MLIQRAVGRKTRTRNPALRPPGRPWRGALPAARGPERHARDSALGLPRAASRVRGKRG